LCDHCETEMESTGEALTSLPIQNQYKCPNCGHIQSTIKTYPHAKYEEIDGFEYNLEPKEAENLKPSNEF